MPPELKRRFVDALLEAFPRSEDLEVMLALELGLNLETISLAGNLTARVLALINYVVPRGQALALAEAAHRYLGSPAQGAIADVAAELGLRSTEASPLATRAFGQTVAAIADVKERKQALERILPGAPALIAPAVYIRRLEQACAVVGRIEQSGKQLGSGFLVGRDLLLTNQHVRELVARPEDVVVRFDYASDGDGLAVGAGVQHRLVKDGWLIAERPYSKSDPGGPVGATDLDYALLRLATPAAEDPVGRGERGFLRLAERADPVDDGELLLIVQYPERLPLSFGQGPSVGYACGGHRLRYRIQTEHGSSGSPVLDVGFDVVGLHHSGDGQAIGPGHNQGIPIQQIVADLVSRGHGALIGAA